MNAGPSPSWRRWADHWNAGRSTVEDLKRKREILAERCAEIGRDPATIKVSVSLFERDPAKVGDIAASYAEAGVDMAIVRPERYEPQLLEPFAVALQPLTH